METDYESIDIVFENCNYVNVPAEYVISLQIRDIRDDVFINYAGQYIKTKYCQEVKLELKNSALELKTYFQKEFDDLTNCWFPDHLNVFNDITHIEIKFKDKESFYVSVPWKNFMNAFFHEINILQCVDYGGDGSEKFIVNIAEGKENQNTIANLKNSIKPSVDRA
jgi:hypothetical protein